MRENVIIIGAAGRDFHNFNTFFRDNERYNVVAFTASQIPFIDDRRYPPSLAGAHYPEGIPITLFERIEELIAENDVTTCIFSYSDISYQAMMGIGSRVMAAGANFTVLSQAQTQIASLKPVISVVAVRTGCGKSQTTRRVAEILQNAGKRIAVIRHPMPYGDLEAQRVQRFAAIEDLKKHKCTIEEMEEYEPHIAAGNVVFAGVDYLDIVRAAEAETDVILWDGGNNDFSFYASDLTICVTDPLRAGNEVTHYPGEVNLRIADVVIINKVDTASSDQVAAVRKNIVERAPAAKIIEAESPVTVDDPNAVKGKRVLVVEDGPTLTHGNMSIGAGYVAAELYGAAEIVDPKPFAVGSIKRTYKKFPQLDKVIPALGYSDEQLQELEETINGATCDVVLIGTPIDLSRIIKIDQPAVRVSYSLKEREPEALEAAVLSVLDGEKKVLTTSSS
ncbi:GTPase [bacterium]|nr:GTPase [bacterium]